jgi:mannitol/fructose-specific phosphotransferase system IIA component (Ntr-type)
LPRQDFARKKNIARTKKGRMVAVAANESDHQDHLNILQNIACVLKAQEWKF